MSLSDRYDWIVLGDHPGALLSANLAAKLGLSVLVLTKCSAHKVMFSKSGQCLDPESNFMTGMGERGVLEDVLRKLSAMPAEGDVSYADSYAQVMTPERRLQLRESLESTRMELDREFEASSDERALIEHGLGVSERVIDYWRAFPIRLSMTETEQKKNTKEAPANWSDLLKKIEPKGGTGTESELCSALSWGFSGQISTGWTAAEWIHALALAPSGASFRGGMTAFRKHLLQSAKKLGATIVGDVECRRLFIENRRFLGVQIAGTGNMIPASGCILGASISEYADRMSFTGIKWMGKKNPPKPIGWRFTLALTVGKDAIPPGLSRRVVWKEPKAPLLEIEIADPSDYGVKQAEQKLIFLRTVLPFTQESLVVPYQRMVAARMFRAATEIVPFLEKHVTKIFPDFRFAESSDPKGMDRRDELSEVYHFAISQAIPENLRVYDTKNEESSSGVEGLFVAAGDSFPKLGSLGPIVSAIEATAWIAHRSGLSGPFA